ncbi:hypothetical protein Clacol_000667 [Clathrus columnatus]|uniref:ATP-dependent RNA helicase n=1 Tax=Clathrus columnatus TaxID=1419009 RepID=A0AAV5A3K2_9AGAM|nr:hypothetical protein Clacol_000667 [Clathrus columnatus]
MDSSLILNLADEDTPTQSKTSGTQKGGRWTDRLKAKRVTKRKSIDHEGDQKIRSNNGNTEEPPSKRIRIEHETSISSDSKRPPAQIISSLFTSNPAIPKSTTASAFLPPLKPSNAPSDTSTFEGLGLSPLIISHLSSKMLITRPTAIQQVALPALMNMKQKDAFIQSQTGSGKTLSFLLPILQDLLPLSSLSYIDRSIGTLAIIIAPTRELAKQIYDILEQLLTLRLRPRSDNPQETFEDSERLTRWLIPGLLTGGATKTHEKARLRKGIPILVATPGRLLDHLQNTTSFNVGKCRWLVLDEADRLMELGFEETIEGILKGLNGRQRLAIQAQQEGTSTDSAGWVWRERRNILCSATLREDVQKLAGTTLKDPVIIKALLPLQSNSTLETQDSITESTVNLEKFTPPSQLSQKYAIVPLKLRLVTLVALLRTLLSEASGRPGRPAAKIIVFFSCTDSVDFHWSLLTRSTMEHGGSKEGDSDSDEKESDNELNNEEVKKPSSLLPQTDIYRLHGSLSLPLRLSSLKGFSSKPISDGSGSNQSSILFCTSVASRGLDLPLVRAVVQYDLPTEGGADEYVHRVGRTARAGKGGEAWAFVAPNEEKWVPWVEEHMGNANDESSIKLQSIAMDAVLKSGFGGQGKEVEMRATQVQLAFERWVLRYVKNTEMARKAYLSHIRAYSTHPSKEKHIFHIRELHLGHLAKAFALRDAPTAVTKKDASKQKISQLTSNKLKTKSGKSRKPSNKEMDNAEDRMTAVVRQQGRLTKKGGVLIAGDVSEFQIATGDALETMVRR